MNHQDLIKRLDELAPTNKGSIWCCTVHSDGSGDLFAPENDVPETTFNNVLELYDMVEAIIKAVDKDKGFIWEADILKAIKDIN